MSCLHVQRPRFLLSSLPSLCRCIQWIRGAEILQLPLLHRLRGLLGRAAGTECAATSAGKFAEALVPLWRHTGAFVCMCNTFMCLQHARLLHPHTCPVRCLAGDCSIPPCVGKLPNGHTVVNGNNSNSDITRALHCIRHFFPVRVSRFCSYGDGDPVTVKKRPSRPAVLLVNSIWVKTTTGVRLS